MTNHFTELKIYGYVVIYFQFSVNQASLRISYILFIFIPIGRYFHNFLFNSLLLFRLFSRKFSGTVNYAVG